MRFASPLLLAGLLGLGGLSACSPPARKCADSCLGCCDSSGTCRAGNNVDFCGGNGVSCRACAQNQICQINTCVLITGGTGGGVGGTGGGLAAGGSAAGGSAGGSSAGGSAAGGSAAGGSAAGGSAAGGSAAGGSAAGGSAAGGSAAGGAAAGGSAAGGSSAGGSAAGTSRLVTSPAASSLTTKWWRTAKSRHRQGSGD